MKYRFLPVTVLIVFFDFSCFAGEFEDTLKLAEQGNSSAQNTIGVMYSNGEGVDKDGNEAIIWYKKAAEHGNISAQYN